MTRFKRYTVFLLAVILLFSFAACGKRNNADSYVIEKKDTVIEVSAEAKNNSVYVNKANKDKLTLITKSDMTQLYFDKDNCTVSVYDSGSGEMWHSLADKYKGIKTSAVSVNLLIDGNRYTLSSQSDSVSFDSALYEAGDKGITVSYGFRRTLEDGTKINLTLPVSYTLSDGALSVEVDCANIIGSETDKKVIVTDINILPFFGSSSKGSDGDYILLPDGSGALVDLSKNPGKFEDISLDVYASSQKVLVGAFGMKKGNSAFTALIDEGEEISSVKMTKALKKGGYNTVSASFKITDTKEDGNKVYVSSESYKGKIRVLYRFLSGNSADYIGMAGAVRELLIRRGDLLSKSVDESTGYPFNLSLVFQNHVTDDKGNTRSQTLTTFEQAHEILSSLKAKGFEKINLRMKGIITDGDITKAEVDYSSGSQGDFENLLSYGKGQDVTFFADADILTSPADKGFSSAATDLDGSVLTAEKKVVISAEGINRNGNKMLSFMGESDFDGVSVNDAGSLLFADHTAGISSLKPETAQSIAKQISAVSSHKKLMVDTGNIYSVKYADMIVNLPVTASIQSRDLCSRVPFIQAILHGIVDYSVPPVNASSSDEKAFLKSVEYGAIPYYEWYAADFSAEGESDSYNYMANITDAQIRYERTVAAFSDLRGARITEHRRVRSNVYYTEYDNSTGIYVNYNDKAVTVSGVTVDAMSFLRVN